MVTLRELRKSDGIAAGDDRDGGGGAVHFAAPDDGRRVRALHRLDPSSARRWHLRVLRGRAGRDRHRNRHLPGPATRAVVCDRRMGLRDRLGILGHGGLHGCGEADARLRVRHARRASTRGAGGDQGTAGERARWRRSARSRKGSCASRSTRTEKYSDQSLWSILREDWQAKAVWGAKARTISPDCDRT